MGGECTAGDPEQQAGEYNHLHTISDLGSRNGTFIGDVPCLPGEVLYFETGDEIFLGNVKLTLRIVKQEAEWA